MSIILAGDGDFLNALTDEQARDIMRLDNPFLSKEVAANADWDAFEEWFEEGESESHYLSSEDEDDDEIRLSKEMYQKLFAYIRNHKCACVRNALISNQYIDPKYLPDLKECLELGIDRFNVRLIKTGSDLDLIENCPSKVLLNIADYIYLIEDEKIQKCVADILIAHPDPEIRLALAESCLTPREILEELLHDEEEDVVKEARESLRMSDDEDDEDEDDDMDEERDTKKRKGW